MVKTFSLISICINVYDILIHTLLAASELFIFFWSYVCSCQVLIDLDYQQKQEQEDTAFDSYFELSSPITCLIKPITRCQFLMSPFGHHVIYSCGLYPSSSTGIWGLLWIITFEQASTLSLCNAQNWGIKNLRCYAWYFQRGWPTTQTYWCQSKCL